jgi:hypothetical protein
LGSLITSNILTNKRTGTILLLKSKEGGEIKICVGKKLKKHLSIAKKKRHITEDKEKQLKANN